LDAEKAVLFERLPDVGCLAVPGALWRQLEPPPIIRAPALHTRALPRTDPTGFSLPHITSVLMIRTKKIWRTGARPHPQRPFSFFFPLSTSSTDTSSYSLDLHYTQRDLARPIMARGGGQSRGGRGGSSRPAGLNFDWLKDDAELDFGPTPLFPVSSLFSIFNPARLRALLSGSVPILPHGSPNAESDASPESGYSTTPTSLKEGARPSQPLSRPQKTDPRRANLRHYR
jgi:hypothetical protein